MQDRKQSKLEKKQKKLEKLLTKQSKQSPLTKKEKVAYKSNINAPPIKPGEMKDLSYCPASFDPQYVEDGWHSYWEMNGFFKPKQQENNGNNKNINDFKNSNVNINKTSTPNRKFVIPIPPPNVTGSLHIGHAMMASIQDVLIRYHRMHGYETLYLPGTDHAGIATQAVVEKKLYKEENKLKEDIGRDNFLSKVFEWKSMYGNKIYEQIKRMGSSLDFTRETFTLDEKYLESVTEAFNILYESDLIYRESKMVNWSGKMKTTLSDLEVNHEDVKGGCKIKVDDAEYVFGVLYYFKYPIIKINYKKLQETDNATNNNNKSVETQPNLYYCGDFDTFIEVSTTRPETILGDSAVCVNPKDKREYLKDYCAVNPLTRRIMPIIFDEGCDISFGTGALKITPSHDNTDYEIGKRHKLEFINILTPENRITTENIMYNDINDILEQCKITNDESSKCLCVSNIRKHIKNCYNDIPENNKMFINSINNTKRFDARISVIKFIKDNSLFVKDEMVNQTLPFCSRSNDIIEPMIKKQWWMRCKDLGKKAGDVVRSGEIEIHPPECKKVWYNWVDNIRDWCLSRQLWWGHRIPAWRVYKNGKYMGWEVARSVEDVIERIKNKHNMKEKDINNHNISNSSSADQNNNTADCYSFTYNDTLYTLKQDEDVLDTWFSSGLWPFAIFKWPAQTEDLSKYFPNTLLETGYDILFFWVARMVMLSIQLCKTVPFKKILLHGIVRDAHGKKMSKSLGNVIDPIFVIEGIGLKDLNSKIENVDKKERERAIDAQKKDFPNGIPQCGADALRFGLCAYFNGVKDINLDVLRVEGYRRLCNKIWNAYKFLSMCKSSSNDKEKKQAMSGVCDKDMVCIGNDVYDKGCNTDNGCSTSSIDLTSNLQNNSTSSNISSVNTDSSSNNNLTTTNTFSNSSLHIVWIMHKRNETIKMLSKSIESYNFMNATQTLYKFFLYDFCDIFIEIVKKRKGKADVLFLEYIFEDIMKIFHPFMPFISEEIYQRMKKDRNVHFVCDSISVSQYPVIHTNYNEIIGNDECKITHSQESVDLFENIIQLKKNIRSILDSNNIKKSKIEIQNNKNDNCDVIVEYLKIFIKGENYINFTEKVSGEFIDTVEGYKIGITDSEDNFEKCESEEK
ncbi:hypothetical protein BDAP_001364 [Binucleata daphniae]